MSSTRPPSNSPPPTTAAPTTSATSSDVTSEARLSLDRTYNDAALQKMMSEWFLRTTGKSKSQDAWDTLVGDADANHDGSIGGDELVALLVSLLASDPDAAGQLDSLMKDNASKNAVLAARAQKLQTPTAAPTPAPAPTPSKADPGAAGASPAAATGGASGGASAGSGGDASTGVRGKAGQTSGPPTANAAATTNGGYTVQQVEADMKTLAANDHLEGGKMPDDATLHAIAQGIVDGANNYFPALDGKTACQTLVASAWKESKFNVALGNGGVFQCANNRYQDYIKAHPGASLQHSGMSVNPGDQAAIAQSIDVALWAMSHPVDGLGAIAGVAVPADPMMGFLYFWNYNEREVADYMKKTQAFVKIENG